MWRASPCFYTTSVFRHEASPILVNIGWYQIVASYDMLGKQPHFSMPAEAQVLTIKFGIGPKNTLSTALNLGRSTKVSFHPLLIFLNLDYRLIYLRVD